MIAFRSLLLPVLLLVCSIAFGDAERKLREATCRVTNTSGGAGSGCVIFGDDLALYVLTNRHVAGDRGPSVSVEFWRGGHHTDRLSGTVVLSSRKTDAHDVALVRVLRSELPAGFAPEPIPLLEPGSTVDWSEPFLCSGCAAARWPTVFEGRVTHQPKPELVQFAPRPAGGRSGSPLVKADGSRVIGLVAWRSMDVPTSQHSFDARTQDEGYGVAMTSDVVWLALSGRMVAAVDWPVASWCPLDDTPIIALGPYAELDDGRLRRFLRWRRWPAPPPPLPRREPRRDDEPPAPMPSPEHNPFAGGAPPGYYDAPPAMESPARRIGDGRVLRRALRLGLILAILAGGAAAVWYYVVPFVRKKLGERANVSEETESEEQT